MHHNSNDTNINIHQSCFIAKSIVDENTLMSKLGVSYKNLTLFYTAVLLWSSSTGCYYYYCYYYIQ